MAATKGEQLVSGETRVAVQSAFHALEQAILIRNAWTLEDLLPLRDLVSEMLQPILRSWLNENLPAIVERLVRAEIERTARTRAALDLARRQS